MLTMENVNEDENFVELFRKEHNEQFYVLVRMHLSFLLHMTTEESECFYEKVKLKKWNLVPFSRKSKPKQTHDGSILNQDMLSQVYQLMDFLKQEENLKVEGIFRKTGSLERQHELKNFLLQGGHINFEQKGFTVHDCACVLKGFLAELPEPVTTDIQFPLFGQIAESFRLEEDTQEPKILQTVQLLFLLLPKENKNLLKKLFKLLHMVALYEKINKMSAMNLAKVFTPHLICPRKLAPEILLKGSQTLFGVVAFMIKKSPILFGIPSQLMLDFKTHYEQGSVLNESVKGAAHTVFTFVDNKLTAKENEENVTEAALAELYAHIQSLPESSKKRKLVKQFNKQNGQGTPLQVVRSSVSKNKTLGDSIKKHMFHKKLLKNMKHPGFTQLKSASSEEILNSSPHHLHHQKSTSRGRLFCHHFDSSETDDEQVPQKKQKTSFRQGECTTPLARPRSKSDSDLSLGDVSELPGPYLTSTPACILGRVDNVFTPEGHDRKSMSPITRSAQRMPRAMQETMMTPRSRKPVLLVSGTNINNLAKVTPTLAYLQEEDTPGQHNSPLPDIFADLNHLDVSRKQFTKSKSDGALKSSQLVPKLNKTDSPKSLSTNFKEYLNSRDMLTCDESPTDSSFSSRSDDFRSLDVSMPEENGRLTESMLYIMDGNDVSMNDSNGEKKFILKPRQFDENGKPIVFETSF